MRALLLSLLTLVAVISFIEPVTGVKRYLFRTCDQNPFCKRNRHYADQVVSKQNDWKSPYALDKSSIQIDKGQLTGMVVKTVNDIKVELPLTLSFLKEGGVRLSIDEKQRLDGDIEIFGHESVNKKRYDLSEHVIDGELALGEFNVVESDSTIKIEYGEAGSESVVVQLDPLKLTFYRNGQEQVELNGRGFLNYEHWRPIEGEGVKNHVSDLEIEDGFWEDEFDGKKDKKTRGPEAVALDTVFKGYRHVYGIPEHADRLSLKETRGGGNRNHEDPYRLFNVDIFEYETNSEMPMYGSIPFMLAQKKGSTAGLFWANAADTYIDITKTKQDTTSHWISEAGVLDVFVFMGDHPDEINRQYGQVTGNAALPQEFAIGYNQCRWNYNSEEDVLEVHDNFDKHGIPYDVIWLDIEYTEEKKYFTWNKALFSDPVGMMNQLGKTGRKLVAIVDPHIKNADNYDVVQTVKGEQIGILNEKGELFYGHCWPGESVWIDSLNPNSQPVWDKLFSKSGALGGSADNLHIWNDMNEPSVFSGSETTLLKDHLHYGGWEHRDVKNMWGMAFHNSTVQAMKQRYNNEQRPMVLTRSYFAGSQRVGPMWTGDNMAKWEYLQIATPMVLTSGVSGMPFAGADVGGFFGDPSPELLTRWYQTGLFHPFFRAHAHIDSKRREPYIADPPYNTTMKAAVELRYKLLPSLYTAFYKSSINLSPILKPVWYIAPDNEKVYDMDDEFFFGETGILVKPVTTEGATKVDMYIPDKEVYYDFDTYKTYQGEGSHTIKAPLEKIPMLMRGGHIHTRRDRPRRSVELKKYDPYTLVVAVDKTGKAQGELYADDGVSYAYEDGKYVLRQFAFDSSTKTFTSTGTGSSSDEPFANTHVERIVLVGVKLSAVGTNAATVQQNGRTWNVDVVNENGAPVVRNPKVTIGADFTVTLTRM